MSEPTPYRSELASSIEALFEGSLSDEEAAEVANAVASDPQAAELYWDYVELHAELLQIHRDASTPAPPGSIHPATPGAQPAGNPLGEQADSPNAGGGAGVVKMLVFALCGAMCLAAVVFLVGPAARNESSNDGAANALATVTAKSQCVWEDGGDQPLVGAPVKAGDCLRLKRGSIQLRYRNGVKLTLNGPAVYHVVDDETGFLEDGSALARVPAQAIGFTVNTPAGRIIDCGTEFGVSVAKDDNTGVVTADMRVIDGAVDVNVSPSSDVKARRKRFKKGESIKMSSLLNGSPSSASDLLDPRTIPGLRLWLNADAGVLRGSDGRVTEMIDLAGDSNEVPENPRQPSVEHRPRWDSGTINDRPTLVFTGRQYLQLPCADDLNLHDESLSIFVVGNASGGTQYFLSSRADGENNNPRGFRLTSSRQAGIRYQAAGVTVSHPCDMKKHAVFCVIHDRRVAGANTVTLFRNGEQLGPTVEVKDADISNAFPLTIGANLECIRKYPEASKNYLQGDVGEILIFDRVLTPEQRTAVEAYLMRKFRFDRRKDEASERTGAEPAHKSPTGTAP